MAPSPDSRHISRTGGGGPLLNDSPEAFTNRSLRSFSNRGAMSGKSTLIATKLKNTAMMRATGF